MMLTGKNIKAGKAKRMGLVDGLVKPLGEFLESLFEKKNANFSLISLHSGGTSLGQENVWDSNHLLELLEYNCFVGYIYR